MAAVSESYAVWDVEVGDIEIVVHSIHEARDYAHRRLSETGNPYGIEQVVLGDDGFPQSDGEMIEEIAKHSNACACDMCEYQSTFAVQF